MKFKEIATAKLLEHTENRKLFKDISETNPVFWLEFLDNIKEFGILEPLIVNESSMQVRSGNQRLKAALMLNIATVPVILVDDEDSDQEIAKMIASNVFRRTIDPFAMFEYIGRLRTKSTPGSKIPSKDETKSVVHKKKDFISAADIFTTLSMEEQEALKEWFYEKEEGKKNKSEGELIARLRTNQAKIDSLADEKEELSQELFAVKDTIESLELAVSEKDTEIEELRNSDLQQKLEDKELEIGELIAKQEKLKRKIVEMKQANEGNVVLEKYLEDCIDYMVQINTIIPECFKNPDQVSSERMQVFMKHMKRLGEIAKINLGGIK